MISDKRKRRVLGVLHCQIKIEAWKLNFFNQVIEFFSPSDDYRAAVKVLSNSNCQRYGTSCFKYILTL